MAALYLILQLRGREKDRNQPGGKLQENELKGKEKFETKSNNLAKDVATF